MPARSVDYPRIAFDAIEELEALTTADDVIRHMGATLTQFGFSSFLVASVPNAPTDQLTQIALLDGWPNGWNAHYERQGYFRDDPIAGWGLRTVEPFRWSDVRYDAERNPRSAEVMHTAAEFGLKDGFSIPIVRTGSIDAVTMAGDRPDFDGRAQRAIHLIGLYAHSKALALVRKNELQRDRLLTNAEREALLWVANGKSSWEISVILKISESAVDRRIQRACEKLDAVNRLQAVVKAIRAREIAI